MWIRLFLLLLLDHLIGDFLLQTQRIKDMRFYQIKKKDTFRNVLANTWKGNLIHSGIHTAILAALFLANHIISYWFTNCSYYSPIAFTVSTPLICIFFLLLMSHFLIDEAKSIYFSYHNEKEKSLSIFFADQILHIAILTGITSLYFHIAYINEPDMIYKAPETLLQGNEYLVVCILFILSTFFVGIFIDFFVNYIDLCNAKKIKKDNELTSMFIKALKKRDASKGKKSAKSKETARSKDTSNSKDISLSKETAISKEAATLTLSSASDAGNLKESESKDDSKPKDDSNAEINQGGFIIGIIERLLILVAIISKQPQLIGFIFTAKSIVRLSKLKEDKFAEYFLIGNSLSFLFGIIGGCCINLFI